MRSKYLKRVAAGVVLMPFAAILGACLVLFVVTAGWWTVPFAVWATALAYLMFSH